MVRLLQSQKGLTLIEVMAALVILGIILVPVLGTFTTGVFLSAEARRISQATASAEAALEEYLATGNEQDSREGFELKFEKQEFEHESLEGETLWQITVTAGWHEDEGEREISLTTLYQSE